jgi:hypothetical protein
MLPVLPIIILVLAACSAGFMPSGTDRSRPNDSGGAIDGDGSNGGGGGSSGSVGGAPADPNAPIGSGGNVNDGTVPPGQAALVVPKAGRLQAHDVGVSLIEPRVDGHRVVVRLSWWSGVAPCTVLDSVRVDRDGTTITLTPREGADRMDVACIEIAHYKATLVDLGQLAPGEYTLKAGSGDAKPVTITIN